MDMTTKRWALVAIAIAVVLGFLSLGFAAMSTNPPFVVPNWVPLVFFILSGLVFVGTIIWLLLTRNKERKIRNTDILADIKSDFITLNTCEREVATKEAQRKYPKKVAVQVHNSFVAMFGADAVGFALSLTQQIIGNRDIDPLVKMFKKFGDILDSTNYGLKRALVGNELYETSRTDIALKRLKLKKSKKKNQIIQKNLDRVIVLVYGLNSSIVIRAILRSLPETKSAILAPLVVTLESIEAETEKTLNKMLGDLENEWKVTVNLNAM